MAVAMTLALGGAPAMAQLATPAELPPADYDGLEYVDSAGCVFARIDVGGRVEWVPRVGQDRQQLCGQEPSVASAAAPMPEPMPEPMIEAAAPAPHRNRWPRPAPPCGPRPPRPPRRHPSSHRPGRN
jgi:hypothetical protein